MGGVRKEGYFPHSQRGKIEKIQRIKMRYDIGIHHGKHPDTCHLGLQWAYTDLTSGPAKKCNLIPIMAKAMPVPDQDC